MESSSVYMCFPCYQQFPTYEEVLAHRVTCTAVNPQLQASEMPTEAAAADAGLPQVAVQSVPQIQLKTTVYLSSLLGQNVLQADGPRVLYQCADCEFLFDALSVLQNHQKMGCCIKTGPGPGDQATVAQVKYQETEQDQPEMENTSQQQVTAGEVSEKIVGSEMSQQGLPNTCELREPPETPATQDDTSVEHMAKEHRPSARRRWKKRHKPPSNLLCVECGQSFSQASELVAHRRVQHSLQDAKHRCTVCGEGFINTTLFLYHRRQHRTEVENQTVEVPSDIPGLSTTMLDTDAGEGQTITETPVAQVEVELREEEVLPSYQERGENSEVLVEKIVKLVEEGTKVNEEEVEVSACGTGEEHGGDIEMDIRVEKEKPVVVDENQGKVESITSKEPVPLSFSGTKGQNFLCHQCGSSLPTEMELAEHRSTDHSLMPALHACKECGAEFMNTTQFLYHRREHRTNALTGQTHSAEEAGKLCPTSAVISVAKCRESMLLRQPATADATLEPPAQLSRDWSRAALPHECPHCGQGFTRRSLLREHVFLHTGNNLFSCKICKKSYPSPGNLQRHILTHGGSCSVCNKSFVRATSLKRHMLIHQGETQENGPKGRAKGRRPSLGDGNLYICSECPASFKFDSQLMSHRLLHISHPFHCNVCGEAFKHRKERDLHSLVHQDKEQKTCPNCSSQFLNQTALDSHLQCCTIETLMHNRYKGYRRGDLRGRLKCEMCGHRCVSQNSLDLHRLSHMGQEPLRCPLTPCRRRFGTSSALGEHLAAHYSGKLGKKKKAPLRSTCEVCRKKFAYASILAIHMRTHTNERPFECSYCDKRFRQFAHLQGHERTHSGVWPFTCRVCEKGFSLASKLTEHARVHSSDCLYTCPQCPATFRSQSNLNKHMHLHDNDPIDTTAQNMQDDNTAVQTILQETASASPPSSSSDVPVVQEEMFVAENGDSSVVFHHPNTLSVPTINVPANSVPSVTVPNISLVAGQDVPHTIEVILEETV